jgi:hypothetical protein
MIIAKVGMVESSPVAMPMAIMFHNRKPDEEACDLIIYQSIMGSRIHTMPATQLDIAYPIGVHWQYNHDPSNEHMVALQGGFNYLNGIKKWCLGSRGASGGALGE